MIVEVTWSLTLTATATCDGFFRQIVHVAVAVKDHVYDHESAISGPELAPSRGRPWSPLGTEFGTVVVVTVVKT